MSNTSEVSKGDFSTFYPVQTRWADNDVYGHVNNVTYYAYFDSVINRYLIEVGGLDIHAGDSVGFIVESKCQFFAPIAYPEELLAGLKVTEMGNSSVTYQVALFKQDSEQACALGHMTHVFVDRSTQRPIRIDGALRSALELLKH
ncbi:thioesterase family protein [Alteromonas sp. ASW11-36]|uniref:Thioesterase family protein n=1 Tax=Alteromonas arenosi TaxID=3055817 RepID=A0ABT7SW58_9ALTE|nr:thioesterase family protein [Alteromonas sp. ASW11-36]MDM7860425.1 thioesterase family protein [Alteromonas sp. ASW11-36]